MSTKKSRKGASRPTESNRTQHELIQFTTKPFGHVASLVSKPYIGPPRPQDIARWRAKGDDTNYAFVIDLGQEVVPAHQLDEEGQPVQKLGWPEAVSLRPDLKERAN